MKWLKGYKINCKICRQPDRQKDSEINRLDRQIYSQMIKIYMDRQMDTQNGQKVAKIFR